MNNTIIVDKIRQTRGRVERVVAKLRDVDVPEALDAAARMESVQKELRRLETEQKALRREIEGFLDEVFDAEERALGVIARIVDETDRVIAEIEVGAPSVRRSVSYDIEKFLKELAGKVGMRVYKLVTKLLEAVKIVRETKVRGRMDVRTFEDADDTPEGRFRSALSRFAEWLEREAGEIEREFERVVP